MKKLCVLEHRLTIRIDVHDFKALVVVAIKIIAMSYMFSHQKRSILIIFARLNEFGLICNSISLSCRKLS